MLLGSNRVIVSTWRRVNGRGGFRRDAFKLAAVRASRTIPGILCEKGKVCIMSSEILVNNLIFYGNNDCPDNLMHYNLRVTVEKKLKIQFVI